MKSLLHIAALLMIAVQAGCRSRVVQVTLVNTSPQPVSLVVVDYPGATFGVNTLGAGGTYHYDIKPLSTGPLKVQFADAQGQNHTYSGPVLHKNDEGSLTVKLTQAGASAETKFLHP